MKICKTQIDTLARIYIPLTNYNCSLRVFAENNVYFNNKINFLFNINYTIAQFLLKSFLNN